MKYVRAILIDIDLSENFWDEILLIIVYLNNRISDARFHLQNITSHKTCTRMKLNINYYRMIECDVWLIIDKNVQNQKKIAKSNANFLIIKY